MTTHRVILIAILSAAVVISFVLLLQGNRISPNPPTLERFTEVQCATISYVLGDIINKKHELPTAAIAQMIERLVKEGAPPWRQINSTEVVDFKGITYKFIESPTLVTIKVYMKDGKPLLRRDGSEIQNCVALQIHN